MKNRLRRRRLQRQRTTLASKPAERRKSPFWRRDKPRRRHDIAKLRPKSLPRGQRFETRQDAIDQSERSEAVFRSFPGYPRKLANELRDCREGDIICDRPHCPLGARRFRRFFFGEVHRVVQSTVHQCEIMTVLLEEADRDQIDDLDPTRWKHTLRKRLDRAGLQATSVIGGFEIVYRQADRKWVLHANLLIIGAQKSALKRFQATFKGSELYRPTNRAGLNDLPRQLSYLLKFTTYHRPFQQRGAVKGPAVPLNVREHHALVQWMSRRSFKDFLFFYNAELRGVRIRLRRNPSM